MIKVNFVQSFLEEFQNVRSICFETPLANQITKEKKWAKPPWRHFRLDVDATFNVQQGKYSVGALIQAHHGLLSE